MSDKNEIRPNTVEKIAGIVFFISFLVTLDGAFTHIVTWGYPDSDQALKETINITYEATRSPNPLFLYFLFQYLGKAFFLLWLLLTVVSFIVYQRVRKK